MMPKLNLPEYPYRIREKQDGKDEIYDSVRKKYVRLTPEEWVRQHLLNFFINHLNFPASLIQVEASLKYNRLSKRSDIVVYGKQGKPLMAVECKAPSVEITRDVFDQLAMYNFSLKVPYLLVTNGMDHYCCVLDPVKKQFRYVPEIPFYETLIDFQWI
jgi:predicted type IV restriction endonuclease